MFGEEPDPDELERLSKRKMRAQLNTAVHNEKQADTALKEAKLGEERSQALIAAGVGPEQQAQLAVQQAAQATQQADLQARQMALAEKNLVLDQQAYTLKQERIDRETALAQAERGVPAARDAELRAVAARDLAKEQAALEVV